MNQVWYLSRRTGTGKVLPDKRFKITNNPKNAEYQRGPASMAYKFFGKAIKIGISSENQRTANELRKLINTNFKKRKVHQYY